MKKLFAIILATTLSACAGMEKSKKTEPEPPQAQQPATGDITPAEEQTRAAMKIFGEMYEVVKSRPRAEILPEIEKGYSRIMNEYPLAGLAQEAHWKLVDLYLRDFKPPRVSEAEKVYKSLIEKYPNSPIINAAQSTFAKFYYEGGNWEQLLAFTEPVVKSYGERPPGYLLFTCAEANKQLGRKLEAISLYRQMIGILPSGNFLAKVSAERLKEMGEAVPPSGEDVGGESEKPVKSVSPATPHSRPHGAAFPSH
ncbi:MAG: hypothetical protein HZA20_02740 [Nitrospirae bacterium]|nr:hypothetical protein [Nitrospirota bacterium]